MRGLKSPNQDFGGLGTNQSRFLTQHEIQDIVEPPHIQNLPLLKP